MKENSFYIETYGCASNKADTYILTDVLIKSNHVQTTIEEAQFVIVNTCAVKEQTENKIKARLKELHDKYKDDLMKHLIIAGCLPRITPNYIDVIKKIVPNFSAIIDLDNINEISAIIEELKAGKRNLILTATASIDKAKFLINQPRGKITGIVPISEGCLGSCTYCCVKNARGKLNCYDPKNIIRNVSHQLKQGIKQIYLTSQDCSIYKHDGAELGDLIQEIVKLNHRFFLRIGMINPSFLINKLNQLSIVFKFDKVYQFLHIPIQSGSNEVLKNMKRTYKISDIVNPIESLREKFPFLTISTDIICGFPGETDYDFYRTINLVKWIKPEILNISKFTARPGTKAKDMKQIPSKVIKERSIRLSNVFRNSLINLNKKWADWEGDVLMLHKGTEKNQAFGRNYAYKNIFINDFDGEFGKFVRVEIYEIDGFNLFASIIEN